MADLADLDERRSGAAGARLGRIAARRDRDRILYSTEFRRLAGVTQVASATEKLLIHNRITHSTKVEQVAMGIVAANDERAGTGEDPYLGVLGSDAEWRVAAAGLGHDLGHPPFGHIGEEQLHDLLVCEDHRVLRKRADEGACQCKLEDGFEGNAQSFRIVTKLSVRAHAPKESDDLQAAQYRQGLDLTRGTLAALTKYPWRRGENPAKAKKWGAYDCDVAELDWALSGRPKESGITVQSIEAQIMDWADDITYAVHDIDDFFRLGIVPLDALRSGPEAADFMGYALQSISPSLTYGQDPNELKDFVTNRFNWFPERPYLGFPADMARINGVVSDLIDLFIAGTDIRDSAVKPQARIRYLNEVLKQLTWYYVIDNPALSTIQAGQKKVIRELFWHVKALAEEAYLGSATGHDKSRLQRRVPVMLKYYVNHALNDKGCERAYRSDAQRLLRGVVDFLSSLTDLGAYKLYARLTGDADVSMLEPSVAY